MDCWQLDWEVAPVEIFELLVAADLHLLEDCVVTLLDTDPSEVAVWESVPFQVVVEILASLACSEAVIEGNLNSNGCYNRTSQNKGLSNHFRFQIVIER